MFLSVVGVRLFVRLLPNISAFWIWFKIVLEVSWLQVCYSFVRSQTVNKKKKKKKWDPFPFWEGEEHFSGEFEGEF